MKSRIIALAGNPNVGKSTVFNSLTGLRQHTGNWPGKTVAGAQGTFTYKDTQFLLVDLPGTYSLSGASIDETVAGDYICSGKADLTIIVADSTCMERNLNLITQILTITKDVILCVNLLDEARKKGISVDLDKLSDLLEIPVVGMSARSEDGLDQLLETLWQKTEEKAENKSKTDQDMAVQQVAKTEQQAAADQEAKVGKKIRENETIDEGEEALRARLRYAREIYSQCVFKNTPEPHRFDRKLDKIVTSRKFGFPIMLLLLCFIFWLTIAGANYPSQGLTILFAWLREHIEHFLSAAQIPELIQAPLMDGIYKTLTWVVSVMLPPMAIFFPLFTLLEDFGYLPRVAFNMDHSFRKCCAHGKQALTMWFVYIRMPFSASGAYSKSRTLS